MLLLLRKARHDHVMNKKLRRYLLYAFGEVLLIITGILIALQIDAWHTERQEERALRSYLEGIATNIEADLVQAERLLEMRYETHAALARTVTTLRARSRYEVHDIELASFGLLRARESTRFDATTSGYEALKVSGVLNRLHGRDVGRLLFDYYETAEKIQAIESRSGQVVDSLWRDFVAGWPDDIESWEFYQPAAVWANQFEEFQPTYRAILTAPATIAIQEHVLRLNTLLLHYENLVKLGHVFVETVGNETLESGPDGERALAGVYDAGSTAGYADVILDGRVASHTYWVGATDAGWYESRTMDGFDSRNFERVGDGLHVVYSGGTAWAYAWVGVAGMMGERPSLDFSRFKTLRLELKGDRGGDTILVNLTDKDDPDDGSTTTIPLQLTDRWETYDIELASFETADLATLHVVLGFLFGAEPQSFWIRNARYVEPE